MSSIGNKNLWNLSNLLHFMRIDSYFVGEIRVWTQINAIQFSISFSTRITSLSLVVESSKRIRASGLPNFSIIWKVTKKKGPLKRETKLGSGHLSLAFPCPYRVQVAFKIMYQPSWMNELGRLWLSALKRTNKLSISLNVLCCSILIFLIRCVSYIDYKENKLATVFGIYWCLNNFLWLRLNIWN